MHDDKTEHDGPAPSPEAHEPPPAPVVRSITPAPEDFATLPPMRNLWWPVFWIGVATVLIFALHNVLSSEGWPVPQSDSQAQGTP